MMTTKRVTLSRDWYPVTDGSHDATIQFPETVAVCRSDVKPDADTPGMLFSNTILTFTKPDVVWVRSYGLYHNADIVIW
ncbi:hypothetical protein CWD08_21295 [Salmonella enterica]|nr:hypothetical protein [Salmonella enterica]